MSEKKRIVVVDDFPTDLVYLAELAKEAGCKVVGMAKNGDEGWALVQERKPNIVLTDLRMPVPGDIIARGATIPIIVVSDYMDGIAKETLEDIGDHVIPLDKGDQKGIIAAIRKALGDEED